MITNDRIIDEEGNVVYLKNAIIDMIYNDNLPKELLFNSSDEDIIQFNKLCYENYEDGIYLPEKIIPIKNKPINWFYPPEYDNINIEEYFLKLCNNETEIKRVVEELKLFKERGFYNLLKFLIYFADVIKNNNLIIGVGRGSSCASYLLYKLNIHSIDSIKYDINISEFLGS